MKGFGTLTIRLGQATTNPSMHKNAPQLDHAGGTWEPGGRLYHPCEVGLGKLGFRLLEVPEQLRRRFG